MDNILIYSATEDIFCIWQRALPRSRPLRMGHGRKPIHRDPSRWSCPLRPAVNGGQDRYRIRRRVSRLPGLTVGVVTDRV